MNGSFKNILFLICESMFPNLRSELNVQNLERKKEKPTEESLSQLNQMILSIPTINDESQMQVIETMMIFVIQFDYDLFRSLSKDEISILINLISNQSNPNLSSRSVDLFTIFLKNDPTLIDQFVQLNLIQIIIVNMANSPDLRFQISCVAYLHELLKIKNELRDQYLTLELPQHIATKCTPYPDKIYFEFLTLLSLKPTFLPELSLNIIQSFIEQEVPQERAIIVIKCLISLIRKDKTLIIPIIQSNFLERIVSSLGRVVLTIAAFLKFSSIALQIDQSMILDRFIQINIFNILLSSLELVEKKEMSFSDMLLSSIRTDKSSEKTVVTAKDKLLRHSCNLMNVLIKFDSCLPHLAFVNDFNFTNCLKRGLPFKVICDVIRFILNYSIKMPISTAKKMLTEEIIRNAFYIASSSTSPGEDFVDKDNEFVAALSIISSKFSSDEEITDLIKNINDEYDNVFIE